MYGETFCNLEIGTMKQPRDKHIEYFCRLVKNDLPFRCEATGEDTGPDPGIASRSIMSLKTPLIRASSSGTSTSLVRPASVIFTISLSHQKSKIRPSSNVEEAHSGNESTGLNIGLCFQ